MSDIEITSVGYGDPTAQELIVEAMADLAARYGSGDDTPVDPAQFDPPHGMFLIAWRDGQPVGCGAWRTNAEEPAAAEVKRMYVRRPARCQGVAGTLLRALEDSARSAGRRRTILETGDGQPEAIALYERMGYRRITNFGHYKDQPGVRSFGRDL